MKKGLRTGLFLLLGQLDEALLKRKNYEIYRSKKAEQLFGLFIFIKMIYTESVGLFLRLLFTIQLFFKIS